MQSSTLRKLLALPIILILLWMGVRYLLPIVSPFLLAALLALAAEPVVGVLQKRSRMPRPLAAGIGVTVTLVVLILLLMVLAALILRQLRALTGIVPDLENAALQGMDSLETWLLALSQRMPQGLQSAATQRVEELFSDGTALLDQVTTRLLGLASGLLAQLPDSILGFGTWLLAGYMISAKLPRLKSWVRGKLPESWHSKYLPMLQKLKRSLSGWLLAQIKLMSITFATLCLGFLILQISYAPLWAAVISLVDALPILGTGMVLVPWSFVCYLQGDTVRAIGLLGVYAAASLLRSILEPRLVGKQLGLDPLVTLLAMYAGYRLWGFGGMIIAPVLAVAVTGALNAEKSPG